MKLTFLGTKGEIEPENKQHKKNTSTLISFLGKNIMIDCGYSWVEEVWNMNPHAIVLTHAHPDHAFGLKNGSPSPVWASEVTWKLIRHYPIESEKRHVIRSKKSFSIHDIHFQPFEVLHSLNAPAMGFRIQAGKAGIFYVPDVAWIPERKKAFKNISVYIGDGAAITRNMVRKRKGGEEIFGHANIRQQLTWCEKEHVPKMIVTHCGSDIVKNEKEAKKKIYKLAEERGIEVEIASDGQEMVLRK